MSTLEERCCVSNYFLVWAKLPQEPDEMVILRWNLAKLVRFVLTEKQKNLISVHVYWYFQEKNSEWPQFLSEASLNSHWH